MDLVTANALRGVLMNAREDIRRIEKEAELEASRLKRTRAKLASAKATALSVNGTLRAAGFPTKGPEYIPPYE